MKAPELKMTETTVAPQFTVADYSASTPADPCAGVWGTACLGGINAYFSYRENKSTLASLQREKAHAASLRIEQFVRQIEQQLSFVALPQLGKGADGIEQRRFEFLKLLRQVPAVSDVAQLDVDGSELLRRLLAWG